MKVGVSAIFRVQLHEVRKKWRGKAAGRGARGSIYENIDLPNDKWIHLRACILFISFPYIRKAQLRVYKESINDIQPTVKSIKFLMQYSGK